jgi:hypothetical protein
LGRPSHNITRRAITQCNGAPYGWHQKQERRLVLPLAAFEGLCAAAGMPTRPSLGLAAEAALALRFLDRLGLLMHHPSVPHLVILRPAEFLFPYFTKVGAGGWGWVGGMCKRLGDRGNLLSGG